MAFSILNMIKNGDAESVIRSEFLPVMAEPPVDDDMLALIGEPDPKLHASIPSAEEVARSQWSLRSFADLPPLCPEEEDKNILFKHNWLALGQSYILVATSGIGKSSMTVQMAYFWVLGLKFIAEPLRPLRICIIQDEDSERDLQEQREGMRRGLKEQYGWTDEQLAEAESKIVITEDFVGYAGDRFINRLHEFQRDNRFDIIVINPVQSFMGADVSSQPDVSHFCREGLGPIMKSKEYGCCIGLVEHTAKIKSGQKDGRQNVSDYGEYAMAGSHEWTDWARSVIAFMKHDKIDGVFDLAVPKRGLRLGWRDSEGNKTIRKRFAHSDGYIFWKDVTAETEEAHQDQSGLSPEVMEAYVKLLVDFIYKQQYAICMTFAKENCGVTKIPQRKTSFVFNALANRAEEFGLFAESLMPRGCSKPIIYIGSEEQMARLENAMEGI